MEILPILNMAWVALAVAIAVLITGALAFRRHERLRRAIMPIALAAGFVAGYLVVLDFPHGSDRRPWYADESWKMAVIAIIAAGIFAALARMSPPIIAAALWIVLAGVLALIVVRSRWDGWGYYAAGLVAAVLIYPIAMVPAARMERLWLAGAVVIWLTAAVSGVSVIILFDQSHCGRMLVLVAVLAGLAGVTGFVRPLRIIAAGAGAFLAISYAVIFTLALFGKPDNLPLFPLVLMAAAPLGIAVAWFPALQKCPWLCAFTAAIVAAGLLAPGLWFALQNMPTLE